MRKTQIAISRIEKEAYGMYMI